MNKKTLAGWLSALAGIAGAVAVKRKGHDTPAPPPPPSLPARYGVRVEVFDGDPAQDNKIVRAKVTLGSVTTWTDGAGNTVVNDVLPGLYGLRVEAEGYDPYSSSVAVADSVTTEVSLKASYTQLPGLSTDGPIFRANGQPWRYRGVSAFKLLHLHAQGQDLAPFLDAYRGYNVLRVFSYTPPKDWGAEAWDSPTADQVRAFVERVSRDGFYVELVLLLDDDPARIQPALDLVAQLSVVALPSLLLEIANEPTTHKHIDTHALKSACDASGYLYASGNYEDSRLWFGRYGTCHTSRDGDWPRRAHDLLEYFHGGGPNDPSEPACKVPWVADEPIRPDQAGVSIPDVLGYFGTCALLGGGATVHTDSGKFGRVPNDSERAWIALALRGLEAFPAEAPQGSYRRIDEGGGSLRTYVVGERYMVRIRPVSRNAPEPGWTALDDVGVLWKR